MAWVERGTGKMSFFFFVQTNNKLKTNLKKKNKKEREVTCQAREPFVLSI